ncbi:response regulator transcription factor [Tepidibacillus sp. HK-1]|uniref:response regulator transcription factor n=1 Tax=Tepidibacillus sp. HK-1 TaxID=1883407 RepID=UPI000852CB20|nr:response regulator transcription factor [Tepidibacillus sp. HK-1]GBF11251.1 transcriptional regulatory protein OmpR [Tepidibacillus sp. HK-1]
MKKTILIVDDETKIREMVKTFLINEGYDVLEASNGYEAFDQIKNGNIDLMLLDLMMPGMDGLQTLREVRTTYKKMPVIMLTAKTDEVDKLLGLEMGADDYITKPFSLRELVARMKAVLRRTQPDEEVEEDFMIRGEIKIFQSKFEVYVAEKKVNLTPTEFKILVALAQKPGRVYSRLQLMNIAMGEAYVNYERSIDTHVSNLRRKVEEDPANPKYIQTVYGIGYRFGGDL